MSGAGKDLEPVRRAGVLERFVVGPVRELVLGLRDAFSPEMAKSRVEAMVPELRRLGSFRFTIDRTARIIGITVPAGLLTRIAPSLAKGAGRHALTDPGLLKYAAILLALSILISLYSVRALITRIRREYPDEL